MLCVLHDKKINNFLCIFSKLPAPKNVVNINVKADVKADVDGDVERVVSLTVKEEKDQVLIIKI